MENIDIKKIAKKFNIPEKEIIEFLENESANDINTAILEKISNKKKEFLSAKLDTEKKTLFNDWLSLCKNFEHFEDLFMYTKNLQDETMVLGAWIKSCKEARQAKEVFLCSSENSPIKSELLKTWIVLSKQLEDVREAKNYAKPDTENYNLAIKKIIKLFT